jgi:hypothetical protein
MSIIAARGRPVFASVTRPSTQTPRRCSVALGQFGEFLVKSRVDFVPEFCLRIFAVWGLHINRQRRSLAAREPDAKIRGDAIGSPMQPAPHGVPLADCRCFLDQFEKGGLKRILNIMLVAKDPATNTQNHAAVAADQRREGRIISAGHEPCQKVSIRHSRWQVGRQEHAKVCQDVIAWMIGHRRNSVQIR